MKNKAKKTDFNLKEKLYFLLNVIWVLVSAYFMWKSVDLLRFIILTHNNTYQVQNYGSIN
jgi:hypothetical protein